MSVVEPLPILDWAKRQGTEARKQWAVPAAKDLGKLMTKGVTCLALCSLLLVLCFSAEAQQAKVYRVGVLLPGEAWYEIIDGLRKRVGYANGPEASSGDENAGKTAISPSHRGSAIVGVRRRVTAFGTARVPER